MTFAALDQAAYAMAWNDPARNDVNYLIAHADDNAADDAGKLESLRCLLSFDGAHRSPAAIAWFAARGIVA